jgi:hypothetical protein
MISGKIVPVLACTAGTIAGFVGVEMYKRIMRVERGRYRAATINLASNVFCFENIPDPVYKRSRFDWIMGR